jgi:membrane-associated phospholipid phosphatase
VRVRVALEAAAYAALAILVAMGTLNGVDQWGVDHAMPGEHFHRAQSTFVEAIVPLLHATYTPVLHGVAEIWTMPASVVPSLILCGAGWLVLWRRGQRRAAVVWAAAWIAGTAIEVLTKATLTRHALHTQDGLHIAGFDASYPSGHTIRAVLLAATIWVVWPVARWWAVAWAAVAVVLTELAGLHTPTDIAGGLLLAALLIELARANAD